MEPLREGLRIISDNGSWSCAGVSTGDIIAPKCSGALMASVDFRFCWNGQLDSPDHRSHLANSFYANGVERCPATHPTVIPRISYKITYNTAGLGPSSGYSLSSDHDSSMSKRPSGQVAPRGSTLHGDYMYGWYAIDTDTGKSFARVWYDNCLAGFKNCDFGDLGDSRRLRAWPDDATVQKATPAPAPLPPNALHH